MEKVRLKVYTTLSNSPQRLKFERILIAQKIPYHTVVENRSDWTGLSIEVMSFFVDETHYGLARTIKDSINNRRIKQIGSINWVILGLLICFLMAMFFNFCCNKKRSVLVASKFWTEVPVGGKLPA